MQDNITIGNHHSESLIINMLALISDVFLRNKILLRGLTTPSRPPLRSPRVPGRRDCPACHRRASPPACEEHTLLSTALHPQPQPAPAFFQNYCFSHPTSHSEDASALLQ